MVKRGTNLYPPVFDPAAMAGYDRGGGNVKTEDYRPLN